MRDSHQRVGGVLLAAGLSTRMGTAKALLDWQGRPLVVYQVEQMELAGVDPVVVVTGHEAEAVEGALRDSAVTIVRNPRYDEGRAGSVRVGAAAIPEDVVACLVLNVDQPRSALTLRRLVAEHLRRTDLITVPEHQGHHGHPAVFSAVLMPELREVSDERQGLRAVVRSHQERRSSVSFDTEEVLLDLNDPQAYARARSAWRST